MSFLFIEIALRELAPTTVILFRIASGALALGIYVALRGNGFGGLRAYVVPLALMGAFNTAFPFFLITWGQQYIDSGLAAILNASAPIFTAVFALGVDRSQRVKHGALLDAQLLAQVYVELTGGRQIGLGLVADTGQVEATAYGRTVTIREPRPARPHHAAVEELERHRAFIAKLVNPLWARFA